MSHPETRVAVLAFPSDHLFGGGLTLLSRIGPELRRRGGALAWIDYIYGEDAGRVNAWQQQGVEVIAINAPEPWYRRIAGRSGLAERKLIAFRPNVIVVGTGTDRPYANDEWQRKHRFTELGRSLGAKIVFMHQLSEPGRWIEPGLETKPWLAWQNSADLHQFVSEATWRETERNFGCRLTGQVVRNNYNVPYDAPPSWPIEPLLRFAFVGRFRAEQKGLDILLDAAARLHRKRTDWHLSLIGGGALQSRVESEVRNLGLSEQVTVAPHTSDVTEIWRHHHVLVMPSRSEGLSLALTEAMLCERPAIATIVGGTADLLVDGETGYRTYLDAEYLATTLGNAITALSNGTLRMMGIAAGARARSVFPRSPETMYVDQLESLVSQ